MALSSHGLLSMYKGGREERRKRKRRDGGFLQRIFVAPGSRPCLLERK